MGSEGGWAAVSPRSHRCPTAGIPVCVWEGEGRPGWRGLHPGRDGSCPASSKRLLRALLPLGLLGPQPGVWKLHTWGQRAWRTRVGAATVRGALPSPFPWVVDKNCVWDTAWGFATLGGGHPFGNRGAGPQQPRCLRVKGALPDSPANGFALVLEGAGTIVQGTMSPGSLQSLGRWGSPEEALPAGPSVVESLLGKSA